MINWVVEGARPYIKNRCVDQGCALHIGRNISGHIIINVECYWIEKRKAGKVIDFLILCHFSEESKIIIVELKGKNPHVPDVLEKMKNFCYAVNEFLDEQNLSETNYDFYPILLSKSISPIETKMMFSSKIKFQNIPYFLIRECCNSNLEFIFKKYD